MKTKLIPLLVLIITLLTPGSVNALAGTDYSDIDSLFSFNLINKPKAPEKKPEPVVEAPKPVVVEPPAPTVYTVVSGDTLTKIGTAFNVEWQRLWAKNTQLTSPDRINVGDQITIPEPSEALDRPLPAVVSLPQSTPGVAPLQSFGGANTYDYGYCTWYVKNRRGASLPNRLGNANTWYSRAAASGMAVGSAPRAGAVGTTTAGPYGHVVYVESVNDDGSVNVSEMNYRGWGIQTSRTAPASAFLYIY